MLRSGSPIGQIGDCTSHLPQRALVCALVCCDLPLKVQVRAWTGDLGDVTAFWSFFVCFGDDELFVSSLLGGPSTFPHALWSGEDLPAKQEMRRKVSKSCWVMEIVANKKKNRREGILEL